MFFRDLKGKAFQGKQKRPVSHFLNVLGNLSVTVCISSSAAGKAVK